jgi:hypothetical protein
MCLNEKSQVQFMTLTFFGIYKKSQSHDLTFLYSGRKIKATIELGWMVAKRMKRVNKTCFTHILDFSCVNIRRQIQFERHRFTIVTYTRMIVHAHVHTINFAQTMMRYDGSWPWRCAHRMKWIMIIPTVCWLAYD